MSGSPESYLSFFGLGEQPFAATADPAYFYATREHKECLFRLWTNIDERHGIAVVLGNYGTGKTTLLRKLLTGMRASPDRYNTAVIGSPIPSWTSFSLLEAVVTQFRLRPESRSFVAYMDALHKYLITNRQRINTLVIDDAQNLNKRGQMELLRLVQNLETPQHKLINLVMFAQLEWTPILQAAPNFLQRVNLTYTLGPLSQAETRDLIEFRLRQAGAGARGPVFEEGAIQVLHAYTDGSPRLTVTVCRNALLLAAQLGNRRIGQAVILHTIQKTMLPDQERQARAAAVLLPPEQARLESAPRYQPSMPTARPQRALEDRANQMLMRAARKGTGIVPPMEFHDDERS